MNYKKERKMKKERIETLVDQFVDANGDTRHFVIAAISEVLPTTIGEKDPTAEEDYRDEELSHEVVAYDEWDSETIDLVVKGVKIGFAICNPTDTFNEELGKTIAIGRARKNASYALYATELGYINTKLVRAFLEQEAEYFKHNPEYKITGYKRK